jgi:hypothetical protein
MTCFWDGILKQLKNDDFNIMFGVNKRLNRVQFIKELKSKNKKCDNVKWMNKDLSKIEKKEIFTAVKDYNINKISGGHLCSSCDYFLVLLCELCKINILHIYMKNKIVYKYKGKTRKNLIFRSNNKHFW